MTLFVTFSIDKNKKFQNGGIFSFCFENRNILKKKVTVKRKKAKKKKKKKNRHSN